MSKKVGLFLCPKGGGYANGIQNATLAKIDEAGEKLQNIGFSVENIHKSEDQVLVDRFSTETRAMMRKSAHQETAQPVPCQMINCFCMYSDYTPLTLEEWVECDQRRRDKADR